MSTESSAAIRKAVSYAEVRLSVHDVYNKAVTDHKALDECLNHTADIKDSKRTWESATVDREMDLSADERSKHEDMSDAAMGRHLKILFRQDAFLMEARGTLNNITSDLEGLEYDRAILETGIKIAVARMNELGGYLQYLSTAATVA